MVFPQKNPGLSTRPIRHISTVYYVLKKSVLDLSQVEWSVKADLKYAYRQYPSIPPIGIGTQNYTLGRKECYIDITMHFGKANLSKIVCTWTSALGESSKLHFQNTYSIFFGILCRWLFVGQIPTGLLSKDKENASLLLKNLIDFGDITSEWRIQWFGESMIRWFVWFAESRIRIMDL